MSGRANAGLALILGPPSAAKSALIPHLPFSKEYYKKWYELPLAMMHPVQHAR
jgi:hypothetical protein